MPDEANSSKLRNVSPDPQLEERVVKGYGIPIHINEVSSYQRLFDALHICRAFQSIFIQYLPARKSGIDAIRYCDEEILLVNRHGFHITLIKQAILIQKFIDSLIYHLICNFRTSLVPGEPSQMLDERRQVLRDLTNLKSLLLLDMLPCILELLADERNPLCFRYLVEKHDVAKLVEWTFCGVEQLSHQMLFASKHTVSCQLLMLPYCSQLLLEGKRVLEVCYLLKLIKAHNYFNAFLEFGDLLFALVNVARKEGIDAESALRASTAKFRRRWAAMEQMAANAHVDLAELSTRGLNDLWDAAKAEE